MLNHIKEFFIDFGMYSWLFIACVLAIAVLLIHSFLTANVALFERLAALLLTCLAIVGDWLLRRQLTAKYGDGSQEYEYRCKTGHFKTASA